MPLVDSTQGRGCQVHGHVRRVLPVGPFVVLTRTLSTEHQDLASHAQFRAKTGGTERTNRATSSDAFHPAAFPSPNSTAAVKAVFKELGTDEMKQNLAHFTSFRTRRQYLSPLVVHQSYLSPCRLPQRGQLL
jgi:hypothetical protein